MTTVLQPPKDGACKGKTELFFPEPRSSRTRGREREAKQICMSCDKMIECLEYSLHHELYGIWGGMGESARERLRRERNIQFVNPTYIALNDKR